MKWTRRKDGVDDKTSCWVATQSGWLYRQPNKVDSLADAISRYVSQLLDEGYACKDPEGIVIAWHKLYELVQSDEHAYSIHLLHLPDYAPWVPYVESHSSPSDPAFQIRVRRWERADGGIETPAPERIGGALVSGNNVWLLTECIWKLVCAIRVGSENELASTEERMQFMAAIRGLAIQGGAHLDDYLSRTEYILADKLDLELKKVNVLGEPVVELMPHIPEAPSDWIRSFDKFHTVQKRYDVLTKDGGMAHVIPDDSLKSVLVPIKEMPSRRVASDSARALLYNPYAVLGENAQEVISPEKFERARDEAGIGFKVLKVKLIDESRIVIEFNDTSGSGSDLEVSLDQQAASELYKRAQKSVRRNLPLFSWEGEEVQLSDETCRSLEDISKWLNQQALSCAGFGYAEIFDLSAYSDRVVGFDGVTVIVPYVAKKDSEKGWIPENVETGFAIKDGRAGYKNVILGESEADKFKELIIEAKARGLPEVILPGTNISLPVTDAEQWLAKIRNAQAEARKRVSDPKLAKDPKPNESRPMLRILHNIESLDYGSELAIHSNVSLEPSLPISLREGVELLTHQRHGLAWLQCRYEQQSIGVSGCLLADDMGLGKTLQAISLMAWHLQHGDPRKPCLVIAPVALLENWRAEIDKFFTDQIGPVLSLYGPSLKEYRQPVSTIDAEVAAVGLNKFLMKGFENGYTIILTTYETLRDYEFSLARVSWGIIVCDEAQKIKNPSALVTRAAKALRADFKVACTGTPVENSLADLWCLFDFFQPGLLGSLNEFTKMYRRSIETREDGHEETIEKLRSAIAPWILRRLKTEVTDLPPKYEIGDPRFMSEHLSLTMSSEQKRLYAEAVGEFRRTVRDRDSTSDNAGVRLLSILHRLRTICSNPSALIGEGAETTPLKDLLSISPKLAWLIRHLERIREDDEKVIIFTEFREVQRQVQRAIEECCKLKASIINGDTSVDAGSGSSRQQIIDKFQQAPGFNVIILSTTAVGFGVNVQAANHVIHFTRAWNPAKEDQATDRAYRIGQGRPVYVYCPTVVGDGFQSFDQRIDELLAAKRDLSRDMLAGAQDLKIADFGNL